MDSARKTVLRLLDRVEKNSSYSNILLNEELRCSGLSAEDKRFATALFYGVLERLITLDLIIKSRLDRPEKMPDGISLGILRMGIYQLLYMDSVPDRAAVDECVKLAKEFRGVSRGFINAVLRGFIRSGKKIPTVGEPGSAEYLSAQYSCPQELCLKWKEEYGDDAAAAMLGTSLGQPPVTVRTNTLRITPGSLAARLEEEGFTAVISDIDGCCIRISGSGSPEQSDCYKEGLFHVQDLSCQICCRALDPKEGETILDICSAPGGKAFTCAELMNGGGRLLAFDLHENRVRLIQSGARRLGLDNMTAMTGNGRVFSQDIPQADRVLCDVPCSGLGVIRRKPEIKYKKLSENDRLPQIQYEILDNSSRYVRSGGRLVYSTCTLSRAENDMVADRFLGEHPDFEKGALPEILGGERRYATITPDRFGSDGFFIAVFNKQR